LERGVGPRLPGIPEMTVEQVRTTAQDRGGDKAAFETLASELGSGSGLVGSKRDEATGKPVARGGKAIKSGYRKNASTDSVVLLQRRTGDLAVAAPSKSRL